MTPQADSPVEENVNPYDLLSPEHEEELRLWGEAVEMAQEKWAEQCNECRLSGTDEVPSHSKIAPPAWYEEWFAFHFRRSRPFPKWDDEDDCPF